MACALGALAGNAADGMQVFQRVQAEDAAAAERMIAAGQVRMELKEDVPRLWLRVTVTGAEPTVTVRLRLSAPGRPASQARSVRGAKDPPPVRCCFMCFPPFYICSPVFFRLRQLFIPRPEK